MSNVLFDIDLDGLAHDADAVEFPPMVKGRTVHIDADFLAYQVTAEKADGSDAKSFEDMQHNAVTAVETLKGLAGAEYLHLHLTPSTSNKGGRFDYAIQREYQGNRDDKVKPAYLNQMRNWLVGRFPGTLHQFCEADDGMSSSQYAALAKGDRNLSVIASKDKDLAMVPGLHLDWDRGVIIDADAFGYVSVVEKRSALGSITKKLKGFGQKWFWAQMLIGDTADNIQGLPKVPGMIMNAIQPTAPVAVAQAVLKDEDANEKAKEKARKVLAERKAMACGPATAIKLLDKMTDNKSSFNIVKSLYKAYGEEVGFTNYRDGSAADWQKVFVSEARMLWMRVNKDDPDCVIKWWKDIHA